MLDAKNVPNSKTIKLRYTFLIKVEISALVQAAVVEKMLVASE